MDYLQRAVVVTFGYWDFHITLAVGSRAMAIVARTFPTRHKLFMPGHKLSILLTAA